MNVSHLVAEPEDLFEEPEAEDILPSQVDIEIKRNAQDDQAIDFDPASNEAAVIEKRYSAIKRVKPPKLNKTPVGLLVEIIKNSSALRKRQYEEKNTYQAASIPTSVLENLDDTDLFFLSMSKITK